MVKIQIKPLSVNKCWMGRRFKTKDYKDYEEIVLKALPKIKIPEGKLHIKLEFGFSNKAADWDNPIKPFVDLLQKKYKFNDKVIYKASVTKKDVKKGKEYIKFELKKIK